ncbi:helix-turn-helix domain-containing protein [Guptibacillus sedimenti]|uniref:helix-turn-helix domain-containing protein n=1 Tax=Guptibacillus sedimenti TaxID=3025680 RepID=UPI0023627078|nr:helix-turn-helix transcriptional regulator [Pseudalkalibacillus sedimenti]
MEELGERIREIRKKKRLTLQQVAGDHLSKGMLSLIENGKANPSFETLDHILNKLEINLQELLGEKDWKPIVLEMEELKSRNQHTKILTNLAPLLEKEHSSSYEVARLYFIAASSASTLNDDRASYYINRAIKIFYNLRLYNYWGKAMLFVSMEHFKRFEYEESLQIIKSIQKVFEEKKIHIEELTQLEVNYLEIMLLFAQPDSDQVFIRKKLMEVIDYSKKNQVYYKTADLYRLVALQSLWNKDEVSFHTYLDKSEKFAEATDDRLQHSYTLIVRAFYHNEYSKDYKKALHYCEEFNKPDESIYNLETGKALFGLEAFNLSLDYLNKVTIPPNIYHPFDLATYYIVDAYKIRCLVSLNRFDEAKEIIPKMKINFYNLPNNPFDSFIVETENIVNAISKDNKGDFKPV